MVRYLVFLSNLLLPFYTLERSRGNEPPIEGHQQHCIPMPKAENQTLPSDTSLMYGV
jgi:hypothetical protein